jgi:ribosomal protein S4
VKSFSYNIHRYVKKKVRTFKPDMEVDAFKSSYREAEIRRMRVQGQSRQKLSKTPSQLIKS